MHKHNRPGNSQVEATCVPLLLPRQSELEIGSRRSKEVLGEGRQKGQKLGVSGRYPPQTNLTLHSSLPSLTPILLKPVTHRGTQATVSSFQPRDKRPYNLTRHAPWHYLSTTAVVPPTSLFLKSHHLRSPAAYKSHYRNES